MEGVELFKKYTSKVLDMAFSPLNKLLAVLPTATVRSEILL